MTTPLDGQPGGRLAAAGGPGPDASRRFPTAEAPGPSAVSNIRSIPLSVKCASPRPEETTHPAQPARPQLQPLPVPDRCRVRRRVVRVQLVHRDPAPYDELAEPFEQHRPLLQ